jgi:hypothetical protein
MHLEGFAQVGLPHLCKSISLRSFVARVLAACFPVPFIAFGMADEAKKPRLDEDFEAKKPRLDEDSRGKWRGGAGWVRNDWGALEGNGRFDPERHIQDGAGRNPEVVPLPA